MSWSSNSRSSRTLSLSAAGAGAVPPARATMASPTSTSSARRREVMRATLADRPYGLWQNGLTASGRARSRLDVGVAELLQLHHARHAARHGRQALQQLAQLHLLALERDLTG